LDSVAAMSSCRPVKCCHVFGELPLTFTQTDLGQLTNRGTPGIAVSVRLCIDACEQLIGQRNHHLRHARSIPGTTAVSRSSMRDCFRQDGPSKRTMPLATELSRGTPSAARLECHERNRRRLVCR